MAAALDCAQRTPPVLLIACISQCPGVSPFAGGFLKAVPSGERVEDGGKLAHGLMYSQLQSATGCGRPDKGMSEFLGMEQMDDEGSLWQQVAAQPLQRGQHTKPVDLTDPGAGIAAND